MKNNIKNKVMLIIVPHPDDEVLGAGGTIAKYNNDGWETHALVVSGHLPPLYKRKDFEITKTEFENSAKILGMNSSHFLEYPATKIHEYPVAELNEKIFEILKIFKPSILLIPFPDRHIDHKVIFEAAMVVSRPVNVGANIKLVACYETLSETHWNAPYVEPNFVPNINIDITEFIEKKIQALRCYKSQIDEENSPRSIEAVRSLARFRGSQCSFKFAETFACIRLTM